MKKIIVACAIAGLAAVAVPSSAQAYTPPGTGTITHATWNGSWTERPASQVRTGTKYATVYVGHKHHHKHSHSHHRSMH